MHMEDMLQAGPGRVEEASDQRVPGVMQTINDGNRSFQDVNKRRSVTLPFEGISIG